MSKWLDTARAAAPELFPDNESPVPRANSANSANSSSGGIEKKADFRLTAQMALTARGNETGETSATDQSPIVCIFCRQPVGRGTPGTGALNGGDLHMDCYRKHYPNGRPQKED